MSDVNAAASLKLEINTGSAKQELGELRTAYELLKRELATGLGAVGGAAALVQSMKTAQAEVEALQRKHADAAARSGKLWISYAADIEQGRVTAKKALEGMTNDAVIEMSKQQKAQKESQAAMAKLHAEALALDREFEREKARIRKQADDAYLADARARYKEWKAVQDLNSKGFEAEQLKKNLAERDRLKAEEAARDRAYLADARARAAEWKKLQADEAKWAALTDKQRAMATLQASKAYYGGASQGLLPGAAGSQQALAAAQQAGSVQAAQKALEALATSHSNAGLAAQQAAQHQVHWNKAANEAHALARGLSGSLGTLWMTYGSLIPLMAGAALGAGFVQAGKQGAEFAYQLQFVKSLAGETSEAIDRMAKAALDLGSSSLHGPREIASGYRILAQAGLQAEDALKTMPTVLQLATVGEMNMEQAAVTLVGVMNAFGLSVNDASHVSDVFAKAAAVSQASVQDMTEAMKYASVVGKQYGANIEDTATAITLLAKVNIKGTSAGTAYRNMLKELYSPTQQAAKYIKLLGVDTKDAQGNLRGFVDIIYDMKDSLEKYDKASQVKILQGIFGERGAKEAVAMLALTKDKWEELRNSIADSKGFTEGVSKELEDTVQGSWKQALNTLQSSLIVVFKDLEPAFKGLAVQLKELLGSQAFTEGLKALVSGMLTLTSTVVSAAPALLFLAEAWASVKIGMLATATISGIAGLASTISMVSGAAAVAGGGLAGLSSALRVVQGASAVTGGATGIGFLSAAFSMLTNPIGLVVGALTVAGTAMYLFRDKTGEAMQEAAGKVRQFAADAKQQLDDVARAIGQQSADVSLNNLKQVGNTLSGINSRLSDSRDSLKSQYGLNNEDEIFKAAYSNDSSRTLREATQGYLMMKAERESLAKQYYTLKDEADQIAINEGNRSLAERNRKLEGPKLSFDGLGDGKSTKAHVESLLTWAQAENKLAQARLEGAQKGEAADTLTVQMQTKIQKAIEAGHPYSEQMVADAKKEIEAAEKKADALKNLQEQLRLVREFEKQTRAMESDASKVGVEAGQLEKYGFVLKTTQIEVAKLSIAELKRTGDVSEQVIADRMAAAAKLQLAEAHKDLAQTAINLGKEAFEAELSNYANAEEADKRRLAKKIELSLAAIEATKQEAQVAYDTAKANGTLTDVMISRYDSAIAAATRAKQALEDLGKAETVKIETKGMEASFDKLSKSLGSFKAGLGGVAEAFKKLAAIEQKTWTSSEERMQAQVSGYAELADVAKGFFKEKSAGYQAMETLSKGLHAVELALALKEVAVKTGLLATLTAAKVSSDATVTASDVSSTATRVAAAGAEATAKGTIAVLNQGNGDPYTAWGRMAAMAAAVASMGVVLSGGFKSGGPGGDEVRKQMQESQGTGTVLGDSQAKSESIAKSLEILADVDTMTMRYSAQMAASLRTIENNIEGFATLLFRNTAASTGSLPGLKLNGPVIGETAMKGDAQLLKNIAKMDSLLMGTVGMEGAMGGLFNAINSGLFGKTTQSIANSGVDLGSGRITDYANRNIELLQFATIETKKKSWFSSSSSLSNQYADLDEEFTRQIGLVFSNLSTSLMAAAGALGEDMDKVGANIANHVISLGKVSLHGMSLEESIEAISAVLSTSFDRTAEAVFGQLADFQRVGEGFYETVVRVASGVETANSLLDRLGVTAISYSSILEKQGDVASEMVRQSIGAVEGMSGIGRLIDGLNGSAGDIAAAYESLVNLRAAMRGLGMSAADVTHEMIRGAGGLDALAGGFADYMENFLTEEQQVAANTRVLQEQFSRFGLTMPATKTAFVAMVDSLDRSTESGQYAYGALMSLAGAFADLADAAGEAMASIREMYADLAATQLSTASDNADAALENLRRSLDAQIADIEKSRDDHIKAYEAQQELQLKALDDLTESYRLQREAANQVASELRNLQKSFQSAKIAADNKMSYAAAQAQLIAAYNAAKVSGSLPTIDEIQPALTAVSNQTEDAYATLADMMRDRAKTAAALEGLNGIADTQATEAEQAVERLDDLIKKVDQQRKDIAEHFRDLIDQAGLDAKGQIDKLNGIYDSAKLQVEGINGVQSATLSVAEAIRQLSTAISGLKTAKGDAADNRYRSAAGATYSYDTDVWTSRDGNQSGTTAQVQAALAKAMASGGPRAVYDAAKSVGISLADVDRIAGLSAGEAEAWARANNLPLFDVGTNYVPRNTLAFVHEGEAIVPKAYNPAAGGGSVQEEMVAELRALREQTARLEARLASIDGNTGKTAGNTGRTATVLDDAARGKQPLTTEATA